MGFSLTKKDVIQAETDAYIVKRLVAALHQLKQCRSAEEAIDYSIVLTAVAPTREAQGGTKGMIAKVAERLRVAPGARYGCTSRRRARSAPTPSIAPSHGVRVTKRWRRRVGRCSLVTRPSHVVSHAPSSRLTTKLTHASSALRLAA